VIKKLEPDHITKGDIDIKKSEPDIKGKGEAEGGGGKFDNEPINPLPGGDFESRLSRLEDAVAKLSHFIKPEERPEVDKAPLRFEPEEGTKPPEEGEEPKS